MFDVDIVDPFETFPPSQAKKDAPALKTRRSPLPDYNRSRLPDNKLSPDTMHGNDSISTPPWKNVPESSRGSVGVEKGYSQPQESAPFSAKSDDSSSSGNPRKPFDPRNYDKEILEKSAKNASPSEKKGLTFDVGEFKHRGYMRMLKEKIEGIWIYPPEAARLGISGDLYINFVIKRDGKLGEVEVVRTSGFRELDKAAVKALKDAEPFWPLPEDWEKEDLEIKGHFIYIISDAIAL